MLSGRGLCDEMITRPEEYYRLCCVVVCDLENLKNEEAMTHSWVAVQQQKKKFFLIKIKNKIKKEEEVRVRANIKAGRRRSGQK